MDNENDFLKKRMVVTVDEVNSEAKIGEPINKVTLFVNLKGQESTKDVVPVNIYMKKVTEKDLEINFIIAGVNVPGSVRIGHDGDKTILVSCNISDNGNFCGYDVLLKSKKLKNNIE
ncbi:MAG: hypothetical protein HY973_04775 [Candidatus Kerfeldbacteria bacterium]|nr:hypothetical protein [Candidatus Kerfeldbacteria bacterium]